MQLLIIRETLEEAIAIHEQKISELDKEISVLEKEIAELHDTKLFLEGQVKDTRSFLSKYPNSIKPHSKDSDAKQDGLFGRMPSDTSALPKLPKGGKELVDVFRKQGHLLLKSEMQELFRRHTKSDIKIDHIIRALKDAGIIKNAPLDGDEGKTYYGLNEWTEADASGKSYFKVEFVPEGIRHLAHLLDLYYFANKAKKVKA